MKVLRQETPRIAKDLVDPGRLPLDRDSAAKPGGLYQGGLLGHVTAKSDREDKVGGTEE